MCGFAGILSRNKSLTNKSLIIPMIESISYRGPDDAGLWIDNDSGIALGHRRLSIIDLSGAGHQPMYLPSGRYILVFNGEIYNHTEIRKELTGYRWLGTSDTETLLVAFENWGIKKTINLCNGMFAFAIWDNVERMLVLGRDRLGEKPLYYGWQGSGENKCFLFGSELKALKNHSSFSAKINRDALCLLIKYNYIPAPHSIYQEIFKLKPAHLLKVSLDKHNPIIKPYWSLISVAKTNINSATFKSEKKAVDKLENLLKSAIKQQMVADVPVGAFLSGGIDSSTVVALMQKQSSTPINTFTIGFEQKLYNEALQAKKIAKFLGTNHTDLYVTSREALEVIPTLPSIYCEPFADSSQIPTYIVSKLARNQVKVTLSGDAGDELFGGYNRYILTKKLWTKISYLPNWSRSLISSSINLLSIESWNNVTNPIQALLPSSLKFNNLGDKLYKGSRVINIKRFDDFYLGLLSHWFPTDIVLDGKEPKHLLKKERDNFSSFNNLDKMMLIDSLTYLPDDILVKLDRASMSVSLESRIPFLDKHLVEFSCKVPQTMKLRNGEGKWILKQVLNRHIPKKLFERPKMGFSIPIGEWLRGPLKDWAENLLDEKRLKDDGFFNHVPIRKKWIEHLSGKNNWEHTLWNVLMFQSWLNEQ